MIEEEAQKLESSESLKAHKPKPFSRLTFDHMFDTKKNTYFRTKITIIL